MKKRTDILIITVILIVVLNLLWLGYNTFRYLNVESWFTTPEIYTMLVFIGILLLFFSHLIIILSVFITLRNGTGTFLTGIVLLITGTISFIAIFFHWGALTDVIKEFPAGVEINNELKTIWFAHVLHFSFLVYSLIYFIRIRRTRTRSIQPASLVGEQLFVSMHIIGMVCGMTGLFIVLVDFYFSVTPQAYQWAIIPYSIFVFIPYLILVTGWLFHALHGKKSGWYDEKQKVDLYKASAFTLFISVPAMFLLFLFNYNHINGIVSVLWLPFYLFVILLLFSASSLYNFKMG